MKKSIFIVGTGMDGNRTLTAEAKSCIEQCELLVGAERMLEQFENKGKECFVSYNCNEINRKISECNYSKVAVLVSGDCGFYSVARKLSMELNAYDVEMISGISSPIYFCGKLGISWQDMKFVSLHGADNCIIRHVASNEKCFFLLGGKISASDICKKLVEYGMKNVRVSVGENLALDNEKITIDIADNLTNIQTQNLCVLVTKNNEYEKYLKCGIDDDEFIRGDVPMTKSEVRALSVTKLNVPIDGICWDIGCGTGSVSIEMALRCPDGYVYSIDKKKEAIELTVANAHKFKCDNIRALMGNAPEYLNKLPAPNCVFIGGSCGKLDGILAEVVAKNPKANVVITAISLESINLALNAFKKHDIQPCIVQAAITKTHTAGNHTMLKAENPVFIISGVKK